VKAIKLTDEEMVYAQIAYHFRMCYPGLIFRFDYGAGATLFFRQAVVQKKIQESPAFPDLTIYVPTKLNQYHGMCLEVKKGDFKIYKKDGVTPVSEHVHDQLVMLERLRSAGYHAEMQCGTSNCVAAIDNYLSKTNFPRKRTINW
jgi:hypothetical protein